MKSKFEKIGNFKKLTNEAQQLISGGGGVDSTFMKPPVLVLTDTTKTPKSTNCTITDKNGKSMSTFDHFD